MIDNTRKSQPLTQAEGADSYLIAQLQEFDDVEQLQDGTLRFESIRIGPAWGRPR